MVSIGVHVDASEVSVLARDFGRVPARATFEIGHVVERTAKRGNDLASDFARTSAGAHGKWYKRDFTAQKAALLGLTWVYGPVATRLQGAMSFELGSRNQAPHLDLQRSADIIIPDFTRDVLNAMEAAIYGTK